MSDIVEPEMVERVALWREEDGTPIILDNLDPQRGNHDSAGTSQDEN